MSNKNDYPFIRKWGREMGSFSEYIERQVERARADKAPENATYYSDSEGKWKTTDSIKNPEIRARWGLD